MLVFSFEKAWEDLLATSKDWSDTEEDKQEFKERCEMFGIIDGVPKEEVEKFSVPEQCFEEREEK